MAVRNVWGAGTLLSSGEADFELKTLLSSGEADFEPRTLLSSGEADFEPIGNLKLQGIAPSLFSSAMKLLIVWLYKSCHRVEKISLNEGGFDLKL